MGVLVRKQKGVYIFTGIGKLAVVGLLLAFASACISTIWAVYIDSFVHNASKVGFITGFFTLIAFISYFLFVPLIEKTDKAKLYMISILFIAIFYILFAINTSFLLFIIFGILITIFICLRISSFGILVRDNSQNKELSKNEGMVYTFYNIAFVVGPLIAGFIAFQHGFNLVFILAAIFVFLALLFFKRSKITSKKGKKKLDKNIIKNFTDFFKNRERRLAYILGGGVNLWWVLIYLFVPLFIIRSGLGNEWIGYFLFAVALPLILFEYHFAKFTGKVGFKKIFKIGYIFPAILAFVCFFVSNVYVILLLLTLASIGMAMLEPTTEAYFFDTLKGKEEYRYYSPYNTAVNSAHLIGKFIPALFLLFLPFRFIFLVFSLFMFVLFLLSHKVKNIIERKRKK